MAIVRSVAMMCWLLSAWRRRAADGMSDVNPADLPKSRTGRAVVPVHADTLQPWIGDRPISCGVAGVQGMGRSSLSAKLIVCQHERVDPDICRRPVSLHDRGITEIGDRVALQQQFHNFCCDLLRRDKSLAA